MKKVYEVTIEDLSHLGTSMGTEYITTLGIELFSTRKKAVNFIKNYDKDLTLDKCSKNVWDGGYVGFTLTKKVIK